MVVPRREWPMGPFKPRYQWPGVIHAWVSDRELHTHAYYNGPHLARHKSPPSEVVVMDGRGMVGTKISNYRVAPADMKWKFSSLTTWLGKKDKVKFLPSKLVKDENFHHFKVNSTRTIHRVAYGLQAVRVCAKSTP